VKHGWLTALCSPAAVSEKTVSNLLENAVEHLAARELDIPLKSWWRTKAELKRSWLSETWAQPQMNDNVAAPWLLICTACFWCPKNPYCRFNELILDVKTCLLLFESHWFREKRVVWTGRTWTWFCPVWSTITIPGHGSTLQWLWKGTAGKLS